MSGGDVRSAVSPAWGNMRWGQWVTFHREANAAAARATRHLRLQLGTGSNRAEGLSLGQPKVHICAILAGREKDILGVLRPGGVTMVTLPTSSFDIQAQNVNVSRTCSVLRCAHTAFFEQNSEMYSGSERTGCRGT